jgi:hypothetical protein
MRTTATNPPTLIPMMAPVGRRSPEFWAAAALLEAVRLGVRVEVGENDVDGLWEAVIDALADEEKLQSWPGGKTTAGPGPRPGGGYTVLRYAGAALALHFQNVTPVVQPSSRNA